MFGRYKVSKINLEINRQLVEEFVKKAGWANEKFRQYKLKIEKNSTLEMKNYGLCKCIIIKKADVDNAEQSKFLVLYNKKKSEVSLWDFDNFNFKNGKLVVDFKMKSEHSLYQVDFCENLDKFYFIPQ